MQPEIRRAARKDAATVGRIIGQAFADDPVSLWVMRKPSLITRFMTRLAKGIYVPHGMAEYLTDERGATMWLPPGQKNDLSPGQTAMLALDSVLYGEPGAIGRGLDFSKHMAAVKPKEPHFYLFTIGVVPGAQGKGLGGALLRAGLEQVDRASMPAYLESSKEQNIPLYQRHGFEILDVPPLPDGCPPIYPMWRPAHSSL